MINPKTRVTKNKVINTEIKFCVQNIFDDAFKFCSKVIDNKIVLLLPLKVYKHN